MKTKLQTGSPPERVRAALDRRFASKEEAALVLDIPLHRLRKACRGDLGALEIGDLRKISPLMEDADRAMLRAYVLP